MGLCWGGWGMESRIEGGCGERLLSGWVGAVDDARLCIERGVGVGKLKMMRWDAVEQAQLYAFQECLLRGDCS